MRRLRPRLEPAGERAGAGRLRPFRVPPPGGPPMRIHTLRGRLYFLLAQWFVIYLAASVLIGAWSLQRFRGHVVEDRTLLARTVAQSLGASLLGSLRSGARLAGELSAVDAGALPQLRAFRFQGPFRDAVHLVDASGRALVSDPPFARPPEVDWDRLRDRPGVTGLVRDAVGERLLALVVPFPRDGRTYFLVAAMKPRGSAVSTFLQNLAAEPDVHLVAVDASGAVIAAPDHEQLYRFVSPERELGERIQASRPLVTTSGECRLCAGDPRRGRFLTVMVPLRGAPWGVVIQQDERRAFDVLRSSQAGLVAAGVLLVAMGVLLSRGLSRSVIAPVQELSRQAEGLSRGDLETAVAVAGDREVRVLARSLDQARERLAASMAELRSLNSSLEDSVAERTRELHARNRELELVSSQRRVLVRRLLAAGEEERRRIARELHDEISQLLTVIQLALEPPRADGRKAPAETPAAPSPAAGAAVGTHPAEPDLERVQALLSRTQEEIHRIIHDLRPSLLDDLGLAAAVRWYASRYLEPEGIAVAVEVAEELDLPEEVEITAFRIYQEIVTNVLRHSGAEHVSVELERRGGRLVLAVEDDGVGFRPDAGGEGAGLVGIRERAALVGGSVAIDSEPGAGTHIRLEIPLEEIRPEEEAP